MKKNMNKTTKGVIAILTIILAIFLFIIIANIANTNEKVDMAVEVSENRYDMASGMENTAIQEDYEAASVDEYAKEEISEGLAEPADRKIVKTYHIEYKTKEYNTAMGLLNQAIKENKGYINSMNEDNSNVDYFRDTMPIRDNGGRYFYGEIKIPKGNTEQFLKNLTKIDELKEISKSIDTLDITEQYKDLELRKKTLEDSIERINEMKESAKDDIEKLILIEEELNKRILELEDIKAQIMDSDRRIDYTTVYINVSEVTLTETPKYELPFMDRLDNALKQSKENFISGLQSMVISFVYVAPKLLIILIIIVVIARAFKVHVLDKERAKNSKKEEKSEEENNKPEESSKKDKKE